MKEFLGHLCQWIIKSPYPMWSESSQSVLNILCCLAFKPLFTSFSSPLAGVNTVTAHSASHPTYNATFATSITRRNLSSVTCATAALVSKPTSTAISRSTSMRTFLVSLQHPWLSFLCETWGCENGNAFIKEGLGILCDVNGLDNEWLALPIWKILNLHLNKCLVWCCEWFKVGKTT